MKYLRKIFESDTKDEVMDEVDSIFMDLVDKFDYHTHRDRDRIMYGSIKNGRIEVSFYNTEKIVIEIRRKTTIEKGFYDNLDPIKRYEIYPYLMDISKKIVDFLPEYKYSRIGGSVFHSDTSLFMVFSKIPFKKEDSSIKHYGTDRVIYVPSKNVYLNVTQLHDNIINVYDKNMNNIVMVSITGYHGSIGHFYNRPIINIFSNNGEFKPSTDVEKWIYNEWESVCKRLRINNYQKIIKFPPKITTIQFMLQLSKNS